MVEGIWNGIHGATQWIKDKISGWVGNVTDFLKGLFGINSPSKLMRDEIGLYLAQGIGVGFSDEIGGVKKMIEDSVPQEFDVGAATAVTRTTEIWELALADIYVGKGVTRIQTQNITDQRFNSAVCGIVTGTVEEIDASVLTKQFTDFFNTYSAAVLDEFSAYKQNMEKYLTEIAGVYDSYVSKTEGLFAQYESQFNERYSSFESTLDNWDKELLSAYTEFMAKIKLFQSDAENEFNTWFESIKDKLGEDIAGSLQLQIEELAAAMQEVKKQAEAGTKETKEAIAALDERLKRVESGWGIDYKHDAVLGLCYMGAAYMSQHYERTVETAVLGATYVGNSYLANTF